MNCQNFLNNINKSLFMWLLLSRIQQLLVAEQIDCPLLDKVELKMYWTSEFANAPFINKPLITDINRDNSPDLIAATFTEVIKAIDAKTGTEITNTKWPHYVHDSSIHAEPIHHDVNNDGSLDVLILTSDAEMIALNSDGSLIKNKSFKLDAVYIEKYWYSKQLNVVQHQIKEYVKHANQEFIGDYVKIDAHILTTPVISDLNNDDQFDEIILPVTYYLDKEYYSLQESELNNLGLKYEEINNYLLGALVIYNMTSSSIIRTIYLDLTKVTSNYPGYILYPPVIADITDSRSIDIILGTSAGSLHVLNSDGITRKNFPKSFDSIHGDVSVIDLNHDGKIEMIFVDTSGIVVCLGVDSKVIWEQEISGSSSPGVETADLNNDGILDVIITTNDGKVWALNGITGEPLSGWPIQLAEKILTNVLLMTLNHKNTQPQLYVAVISHDGKIHLISHDTKCRHSFSTDEISLSPLLLSHFTESTSAQFIIGTKDGALMCIGLTNATLFRGISIQPYQSKLSTQILQDENSPKEIIGSWFSLKFRIVENHWKQNDKTLYTARVYIGSRLLKKDEFRESGEYSLDIDVSGFSLQGHVVLIITNQYGFKAVDTKQIRINMSILNDLKWLLFIPFMAHMVVLLFLHGFPAKDHLPTTVQQKTK
ncbi:uncharacterized protein LOC141915100 [Tubulanus polymorphus]|uniref:uncharacterized protein LOC141915100 n=1 Tax=Tubulanus polymorphus TaxID=672921 RepID=UPI003DA57B12